MVSDRRQTDPFDGAAPGREGVLALLTLSCEARLMRLYRALLFLYPTSFRHEYGGEMAAVFASQQRDATTLFARLSLWIAALVEIVTGATAVHLDVLGRDLRVAARQVRRAPGFAATAVVLIALGTGANTAVFAVADFVLLRPLAFPESDRLVRLWESVPGYNRMELSPPNYEDWKARSSSLDSFGALTSRRPTCPAARGSRSACRARSCPVRCSRRWGCRRWPAG